MIFDFFKRNKKEINFIKILNIVFVTIFMLFLILPSLFRNRLPKTKSKYENRYLAEFPNIVNEDNEFNTDYFKQFDNFANDNLWLRDVFIHTYSQIMYDIFSIIEKGSNFLIGQKKEVYFVGEHVLDNYIGDDYIDEKTEEKGKDFLLKLDKIASISSASFYYIQMADKEMVEPENFPKAINKISDENEVDRFINKMKNETNINVYYTKEYLLKDKNKYDIFSRTGDVTHWSERGAFNTYVDFMKQLRDKEHRNYKILKEEDFDIKIINADPDLYGGIVDNDKLESFYLKNQNFKKVSDEFEGREDDGNPMHRGRYLNNKLNGSQNILLIGDSYISTYWLYYLPESFHNTIFLYFGNIGLLPEAIIKYKPDIIIFENASREFFLTNEELDTLNDILDKYIEFFEQYRLINKMGGK